MQTDDERAEADVEAQRVQSLRVSLKRERDGYRTRGLDGRAEQVEAELRHLDGDGQGDAKSKDEAEQGGTDAETGSDDGADPQPGPGPLETAEESKPRRTAGTRRKS